MNTLMERIIEEGNLYDAWRRVRANRGGPGVDAVRLEDFEADLPRHLQTLALALKDETYVPLGLRPVTIPKKDGSGERALAIPTILDRVAQRAFVNVLDPVFEATFLPCSFGYRVGRGVPDAVEQVLRYRSAGFDWMVDADITDFFGSVDHGLLQERLRGHIADRAVLRTIGLWLAGGVLRPVQERTSLLFCAAQRVRDAAEALAVRDAAGGLDDVDDEDAYERSRQKAQWKRFGEEALRLAWENRRVLLPIVAAKGGIALGVGAAALAGGVVAAELLRRRQVQQTPRATGTPQGGPISPLLSNVYLHSFDRTMTDRGLRLVRYADDFVLCCPSEARARHALRVAGEELARLRLTLHPEKTRIVPCQDALSFLGYAFDADGAFPEKEDAVGAPGNCRRRVQAVTTVLGAQAERGVRAVKRAGRQAGEEIQERWQEP